MRRLSDTLARLRNMADRASIEGARADHLDELIGFGSNPGNLRGWLHLPASFERGAPMVVVLHGCTQSAADYDRGAGWSELADRYGFAVLFPEQQRANNPNSCFNWFVPADTRRGSGEALSVRQMIETAVAAHHIDPGRIFVTGLSAGGAMTSVMLATYPDLFAGGAIIAGLPYGTATSMPQAFDRMRGHGGPSGAALGQCVRSASEHGGPWPTISVWHGTADATVNPANATMIVEQWLAVHGAGGADPVVAVDGYPHTVWRDPAGRMLVEQYQITGLGHGTPISTRDGERCGAIGPFALEAGISSTHHIARSWNLLGKEQLPLRQDQSRANQAQRGTPVSPTPLAGPAGAIDNALRAAGLIR